MDYNTLSYIILAYSEIRQIDFTQVYETYIDTVRLSIDGSKTFVKYSGDMPSSIAALTTKEGPYTHSEMLTILDTAEWKPVNPFNPPTS
jgi:hypothetical protein